MDTLIEKYPIISAQGFYDAQGNFYDTTDLSVIPEEMQAYWMLNYSRLFDAKACRRDWFE